MFFPESKGRELEDFDRLFAGEEDAAIVKQVDGEKGDGQTSLVEEVRRDS